MWQRGFQPNSETKANELCALVHNHNGKCQKLGEKITRWLSNITFIVAPDAVRVKSEVGK